MEFINDSPMLSNFHKCYSTSTRDLITANIVSSQHPPCEAGHCAGPIHGSLQPDGQVQGALAKAGVRREGSPGCI